MCAVPIGGAGGRPARGRRGVRPPRYLLAVHQNTIQPETLGVLLRHFVATEGPPPAAEVVSGQRGRARSETLRWRLDPGPRTGTSAAVGHRMKKDDPPALDEGTLCWCCGAPSPCRCDPAGKRNECGWCRDHCRCFRDGETSDALWPIKIVSPLAEGRREAFPHRRAAAADVRLRDRGPRSARSRRTRGLPRGVPLSLRRHRGARAGDSAHARVQPRVRARLDRRLGLGGRHGKRCP